MSRQYGNYLIFDGVQSNLYDVWISGTGTFDAAERDLEFIEIPGKSGDLVMDNGRYKNIEITYPAFMSEEFDSKFDVFRALMLSKTGYRTLEDTYHPDEFRTAALVGGFEVSTGPYNKAGRFNITFNCKPQRWLKSGLAVTAFSSAGSISNPTQYASKPNIRVYGYGSVGIGSTTLTIAAHGLQYIDIDCEAMDAFCGATNANQYVSTTGYAFPVLSPGSNGISLSGNISQIQIMPRWFTL